MNILIDILLKIGGVLLIVFGIFQFGKTKSEKDIIEKKLEVVTKENNKNEKIDSVPFVDKPFSKMKRKE